MRVASDLVPIHEAVVYRRHCTRDGVIGQVEWTLRWLTSVNPEHLQSKHRHFTFPEGILETAWSKSVIFLRGQIHLRSKRPDCKCLFDSEALVMVVPSIASLYPGLTSSSKTCCAWFGDQSPVSAYPKYVTRDDLGGISTSRGVTVTDILLACQQERSK